MTPTRRRFASLIAFSLATAVSACGSDGLVLPEEARPTAIAIVSGDAQSAPAGAALGQALVVRVTDALNRPVEGQAVGFTIDAGGGQVTPASAKTGPDGQASASWTLGGAAGQQRVQATVAGTDLPASLMVKFNASAFSGDGAILALVSGDNQHAAVGSALADSLVVRVTDVHDNPVAGVQVAWSVGGGGSISPATVTTDAEGKAAAERVLGNTSGAQTAQASTAALTPVSFTHTAEPANPTALVLISGDGQSGAAGAALADSLVVRLQDNSGNGIGGKAITWVVATGGGTVGPVTATTNPNGFAGTRWTLGANAGSNLLNAVFSGLPSVPFTATAQAGAAVKLGFLQPPVTSSAGSAITPAVKVAIQDAAGNTVTAAADAVTLAIGANPGSGTLSGTTTVSAVNGVATFSNLSIDKTGSGYTLSASAGSLAGTTSPAFDILPGNANQLVFIVGPTDRRIGEKFSPPIQVQVQDAGGNPVLTAINPITLTSSVTGTLSGTASAVPFLGTATFSNLAVSKAGSAYTLTALSSNVVSKTSAPFNVLQGETTIAITGRSPSTSVPGQNVTVSYDVNITSPAAGSLTGTVVVTDGVTSCPSPGGITAGSGVGSCTLAFPTAGTHELTATYSGDANFLGSTSAAVSHTVNKAGTTIAIQSDAPDPSLVGEAVTVQWNLTSSGSAPLGGTVTVVGGALPGETCSVTAALGSGSCSIAFGDNGPHSISATYSGDANYNGSTDGEAHAVKGATSTTVVSSVNPSTAGQSVTFTAHVAATSGSGNPTGSVKFFDGAVQIGQDNLNSAGDAAISTVGLAEGSHSITAVYQGTSTFATSTSAPVAQTVDPVPNVPPTALNDSYSTPEDGGQMIVNVGNGVLKNDNDPDDGPQALTATNAVGPANGTLALASDGSFSYTPNPNFNGTDTFTYQAFDGSSSSTAATVTITVTDVNDAPSFTSGGPVTASAGSSYSQPWAVNASPGPADESLLQALDYQVSISPSDEAFFDVLPAITPDGTLTFTPKSLFPATVHVIVVLHDDGGTAGGGDNTSDPQTFDIFLGP